MPFEREYLLGWTHDGHLQYTTEGLQRPVVTGLKAEHIMNFYQEVAEIQHHRDLGPRPEAVSVDGSPSYSPCNYCVFKDTCDAYEGDYDTWLDEVHNVVRHLKEELNGK